MKVIKILTELDFGGIEKVTQLVAYGMKDHPEVQLEVWSLGKGGKVAEELSQLGIRVKVWSRNPKIPNWKLIIDLKKSLKTNKPDIVHTAGAEANFHGLLSARLARVPVRIGEEIGIPKHHKAWTWIFRGVYSTAHSVITISEAVKQNIVNKREIVPEKAKIIYNPAQLTCQNILEKGEKNNFTFVMISRLSPIKNIPAVIKSLANIIHTTSYQARLRIVGEGEEKERLKSLAEKLGIGSCVEFLGYQADITQFLCESDVFLLPSFSEGSSVALSEAMMAGLPSVITKVGGATEIIGKSNSAKVIAPYDPQSIENAMLQFLQMTKGERIEMGQRAQKEAQKFTVQNHVRALLGLYRSLLKQRK
ncbi:glycosyltransferase [Echinicola sp. 20G]|uniref:glycosyltransferase n=1 Tax=Echinicola sp. 20G TaxID=2781961 RepID=UPI001910DD1D|nr:glycosyltransferase [Echinicola sp. 20G]